MDPLIDWDEDIKECVESLELEIFFLLVGVGGDVTSELDRT